MRNSSDTTRQSWLESENLLRSISETLLARKWLILGATILTFALTALATWLMKPVYTTSASILVKKERFDAPVTPEQMFPSGHPDTRLTEEEVNSEVEILNSASLHEQVIQRLQLEKAYETRGNGSVLAALRNESKDTKLSALALALADFEDQLFVEPIKKTNMIRITFKANDREQAAQVVNTLCEVYQERHVKLRENAGATDFFSAQATAMRSKLQEKEAQLKRISPLPNAQLLNQQTETQIRQLNEFEVALATTRTAIAESEARIRSLERQVNDEPERLQSEQRIAHRVAPDAIRSQLFALELRRTELLSKYKPTHRLIRDLDKDLDKARRMVEQVEKAPAESSSTLTLNPLRQRLMDTLTTERSALAALQEKERALANTVAQTSAKVRDLGARGYDQRRLDRERDLADQAYQLYAKKGEESRVSTALDKQGIINVKVAEPARVPFKATSPNILLNLIMGLIGGLILGLALTFTLEYFQPTIRPAKPIGMIQARRN
jgi:polysaccharide biosynthesis transport protein